MDANAEGLLPVYIFCLIGSWFITILMLRRWNERKTDSIKWLSIAFITFSAVVTIILIGYLEMYISGWKKEIYKFSLAAAYSGIMLGNCFLIKFSRSIFEKKENQKVAWRYIAGSLIIAVIMALPYNYYGVPTSQIPVELTFFRTISSGLMMLFSWITYTRIYKEAQRISKIVEDRWASAGLKLIAYSQICMMLMFVFFLIDTILFTVVAEINGYTVFVYMGWGVIVFFFLFSYLGLIMPNWFKHYLEKRDKK
jgi:hypothetical protein